MDLQCTSIAGIEAGGGKSLAKWGGAWRGSGGDARLSGSWRFMVYPAFYDPGSVLG